MSETGFLETIGRRLGSLQNNVSAVNRRLITLETNLADRAGALAQLATAEAAAELARRHAQEAQDRAEELRQVIERPSGGRGGCGTAQGGNHAAERAELDRTDVSRKLGSAHVTGACDAIGATSSRTKGPARKVVTKRMPAHTFALRARSLGGCTALWRVERPPTLCLRWLRRAPSRVVIFEAPS